MNISNLLLWENKGYYIKNSTFIFDFNKDGTRFYLELRCNCKQNYNDLHDLFCRIKYNHDMKDIKKEYIIDKGGYFYTVIKVDSKKMVIELETQLNTYFKLEFDMLKDLQTIMDFIGFLRDESQKNRQNS